MSGGKESELMSVRNLLGEEIFGLPTCLYSQGLLYSRDDGGPVLSAANRRRSVGESSPRVQ